GAKYRASLLDIKKRADGTGTFQVQFAHGSANEPAINGLQVLASGAVTQPPSFSGIVVTNDTAILTWQTVQAVIYQAQYNDDLTNSNWVAVGNPQVAVGSNLSATNNLGGASQRFYRVVQMN